MIGSLALHEARPESVAAPVTAAPMPHSLPQRSPLVPLLGRQLGPDGEQGLQPVIEKLALKLLHLRRRGLDS